LEKLQVCTAGFPKIFVLRCGFAANTPAPNYEPDWNKPPIMPIAGGNAFDRRPVRSEDDKKSPTTEAAMRNRFALSGIVAFALIGSAFALEASLEAFGPISLSQQAPRATQQVMSVGVVQAGWTSPNCPAGTS
jgi:hypothetical protein